MSYVGRDYFDSVAYADDIVLLSPTIGGLRKMLESCEEYCRLSKLRFNASTCKSVCVCFRREKNVTLPQLSLSGKVIEWRNEVKHLGKTL